jgi:hypothetical protein
MVLDGLLIQLVGIYMEELIGPGYQAGRECRIHCKPDLVQLNTDAIGYEMALVHLKNSNKDRDL